MKPKLSVWHSVSPMKLILGGYCLIILVGTLLLTLPISTRMPGGTPIIDCFFTATSSTCVTGLIQYDTFTHWTIFGQIVMLCLVQVGGVGFMTITIMIMIVTGRKISLSQRSLMQNSIAAPQIGGIVRMTKFVTLGTLIVESVGAILLSFSFIPKFGVAKGIYFSIFHSISAFCNAGFDLMGDTTGKCSSLTGLVGDWYVNIVIMSLIVIGGLGFFVWHDIGNKKMRFKKLNLQSKIVLFVTTFLIFFGVLLIFIFERGNQAYGGLTIGEQVLASLFQSVTSRTAGFNTVDLGSMSEPSKFIMICLMFIGGSPGSTAGGIKTTTFLVLCISVFTTFKRKKNIEVFGRRMEENITRLASCVFMIYLFLVTSVAVIISFIEGLPLLTTLFEASSAMATVGSSFGITSILGTVSKLLLIFLMICGRVGSVTMLLAFSSEKRVTSSSYPLEIVQVG